MGWGLAAEGGGENRDYGDGDCRPNLIELATGYECCFISPKLRQY